MPEAVYEIELKSLLNKDQYEKLSSELPKKMRLVSDSSIVTHKFKSPQVDIRLRHSSNTFEIVCKNGTATDISRKEITVPLNSIEEINSCIEIFTMIGMTRDPSWITHRKDLEYEYKGHVYNASLQHTENFAYILEIEYLSDNDEETNTLAHENNIREIFAELNCVPINNKEFQQKIKDYIKDNKA